MFKSLKSRIGWTGAVLCGLLACAPASARAQAGSVIFAAGDVRIVDAAGRERRVVKGDTVSEGETLVSGARASAQLRMKDGGFIALRPDSRLRVDTYFFSGREDGTERSLLSLLKGGFRTITGLIGRTQKDRYIVRTPTATIGIRGTDHEPLYIAPPVAGETPMGPPGTYDKVNVGIAYIETPTGSVDILPNQVGFAAPGAVPQVLPRIPEFFRATGAPSAERPRVPAQTEADQAAAQREQVASDAPARPPREEAALPAPPPAASVPEPAQAVTGTNETSGAVDLTSQTVTDPAGNTAPIDSTATNVRVPNTRAAAISYGSAGGFAVADDFSPQTSEVIRDPATNALIGVGEQFQGFGWSERLIAPTPVTPAVSTTAAGIEYGRWSGGTLERSWTAPIGTVLAQGEGFVNAPRWGYAPEGYLDAGYIPGQPPLVGTFNYAFDAATAPIDRVSGRTGTLNSAKTTFTADFTNSLWSANIDVTIGTETWTANAANVSFGGNRGSAFAEPGGQFNNLTVTRASCTAGCLLGGSIDWGFTGQNYRGLLLAYNVYEQSASGGSYLADIGGTAAFTRNNVGNPTVTDGTPAPTGNLWVADTNGGLALTPASRVAVGSGGLLTGYGMASAGFYFNVSTSAGTTGTAISATDTATGIVLGTWDGGSTTYVYGEPLGTGQFHWALGPEATPLYLPQVLTGTLTYALDAATPPTNQAGVAGALNSASLQVDFGKQTVDVGLNLTVAAHNWVASATGMRLDGRRFDSYNAVTPMTVTVDPGPTSVSGGGEITGSLTGLGLNGAAVSYALDASLATGLEAVNGVLAFSAAAQNITAPYRIVGATGHNLGGGAEPWNYVNGEFNAASRVAFDTATPPNLTTFDSSTSAISGSMAVNVTPGSLATLTDAGTDSTTGISWGRWAGDVVVVTDRATGTIARVPNPGSLHWIAGPEMTGPVALPTSGTFAYTKVGNTNPTDQLGSVGTLNSATLTANFSAMKVDAQVSATVAGTTLDGLAQGMAIMPRGHFGTETGTMTVTCSGICGTATAGSMGGAFTGATGNGAALLYHMTTTGALPAPIAISGAAAFKR